MHKKKPKNICRFLVKFLKKSKNNMGFETLIFFNVCLEDLEESRKKI